MRIHQQFVFDGPHRHLDAIAAEIHKTVTAEFADQLAAASPLRRALLRWAVRQEVRRRMASAVSSKSLY